ncbi:putative HSP20-like chaperone [Helianthus anomalus]
MDFKLDLKLPNEVDLSISKNEQVVVFASHQTDSMFILTSDLKKGGYERKDIKIEINEDGSRMTISGEKPNIRGFQKTFIIPEGVALDKVKARFDQDQSRLTIRMPKLVKGVVPGDGIQELKHPTPGPGKGITSAGKQAEDEEIKQQDQKPKSQQEKNEEERKQQDPKPESQHEKAAETEKSSSSSSSTTSIIAGSTLLMSLIVVFFGFIRSKNESTKKTN